MLRRTAPVSGASAPSPAATAVTMTGDRHVVVKVAMRTSSRARWLVARIRAGQFRTLMASTKTTPSGRADLAREFSADRPFNSPDLRNAARSDDPESDAHNELLEAAEELVIKHNYKVLPAFAFARSKTVVDLRATYRQALEAAGVPVNEATGGPRSALTGPEIDALVKRCTNVGTGDGAQHTSHVGDGNRLVIARSREGFIALQSALESPHSTSDSAQLLPQKFISTVGISGKLVEQFYYPHYWEEFGTFNDIDRTEGARAFLQNHGFRRHFDFRSSTTATPPEASTLFPREAVEGSEMPLRRLPPDAPRHSLLNPARPSGGGGDPSNPDDLATPDDLPVDDWRAACGWTLDSAAQELGFTVLEHAANRERERVALHPQMPSLIADFAASGFLALVPRMYKERPVGIGPDTSSETHRRACAFIAYVQGGKWHQPTLLTHADAMRLMLTLSCADLLNARMARRKVLTALLIRRLAPSQLFGVYCTLRRTMLMGRRIVPTQRVYQPAFSPATAGAAVRLAQHEFHRESRFANAHVLYAVTSRSTLTGFHLRCGMTLFAGWYAPLIFLCAQIYRNRVAPFLSRPELSDAVPPGGIFRHATWVKLLGAFNFFLGAWFTLFLVDAQSPQPRNAASVPPADAPRSAQERTQRKDKFFSDLTSMCEDVERRTRSWSETKARWRSCGAFEDSDSTFSSARDVRDGRPMRDASTPGRLWLLLRQLRYYEEHPEEFSDLHLHLPKDHNVGWRYVTEAARLMERFELMNGRIVATVGDRLQLGCTVFLRSWIESFGQAVQHRVQDRKDRGSSRLRSWRDESAVVLGVPTNYQTHNAEDHFGGVESFVRNRGFSTKDADADGASDVGAALSVDKLRQAGIDDEQKQKVAIAALALSEAALFFNAEAVALEAHDVVTRLGKPDPARAASLSSSSSKSLSDKEKKEAEEAEREARQQELQRLVRHYMSVPSDEYGLGRASQLVQPRDSGIVAEFFADALMSLFPTTPGTETMVDVKPDVVESERLKQEQRREKSVQNRWARLVKAEAATVDGAWAEASGIVRKTFWPDAPKQQTKANEGDAKSESEAEAEAKAKRDSKQDVVKALQDAVGADSKHAPQVPTKLWCSVDYLTAALDMIGVAYIMPSMVLPQGPRDPDPTKVLEEHAQELFRAFGNGGAVELVIPSRYQVSLSYSLRDNVMYCFPRKLRILFAHWYDELTVSNTTDVLGQLPDALTDAMAFPFELPEFVLAFGTYLTAIHDDVMRAVGFREGTVPAGQDWRLPDTQPIPTVTVSESANTRTCPFIRDQFGSPRAVVLKGQTTLCDASMISRELNAGVASYTVPVIIAFAGTYNPPPTAADQTSFHPLVSGIGQWIANCCSQPAKIDEVLTNVFDAVNAYEESKLAKWLSELPPTERAAAERNIERTNRLEHPEASLPTTLQLPPGAGTHAGYTHMFAHMAPSIRATFERIQREAQKELHAKLKAVDPEAPEPVVGLDIHVAGHSLGGGLAQLCGAFLSAKRECQATRTSSCANGGWHFPVVNVHTAGAPPVFDPASVREMHSRPQLIHRRFAQVMDPITFVSDSRKQWPVFRRGYHFGHHIPVTAPSDVGERWDLFIGGSGGHSAVKYSANVHRDIVPLQYDGIDKTNDQCTVVREDDTIVHVAAEKALRRLVYALAVPIVPFAALGSSEAAQGMLTAAVKAWVVDVAGMAARSGTGGGVREKPSG